jgi:hypothetical protein
MHQGIVEDIFLKCLATLGVYVERPRLPMSIDIQCRSPSAPSLVAHPMKVRIVNHPSSYAN